MKSRKIMNFLGAITFSALMNFSIPKAAAAADMHFGAQAAATATSTGQAVKAYYYYRGHRYPYRYRGQYFYHRRLRGGHWRYY